MSVLNNLNSATGSFYDKNIAKRQSVRSLRSLTVFSVTFRSARDSDNISTSHSQTNPLGPLLLMRHEAVAIILAIGEHSFYWELRIHWLKFLGQGPVVT